MASARPKAVVVGGSIAGLMAAIVLRDAGYSVMILERRIESEFQDRGAGLGIRAEVANFFERFSTSAVQLRTQLGAKTSTILRQDGSIEGQVTLPAGTKLSSWSALVDSLLSIFLDSTSRDVVHSYGAKVKFVMEDETGKRLSITYEKDGVDAHIEKIDLVIGADGARSAVRDIFMSGVSPKYAGYACHRVRVPSSKLTSDTLVLYKDTAVVQVNNRVTATSYFLPARGQNKDDPDVMLAYYSHYSAQELEHQLTGADGHKYMQTLPAGKARQETLDVMRKTGREKLCPQFQQILDASPTESVMIQSVADLSAEQNAFLGGKVLLVGEAVSVLRPHCFAGTAQAAFHALRLGDFAKGRISVQEWSRDCLLYSDILSKEGMKVGEMLIGERHLEGFESWHAQIEIMSEALRECSRMRERLGK